MAEPKTICCPQCGRAACHYNGWQKINPVGRCKKCNELVVYIVETGKTEMRPLPPRHSSGMTFY